MSRGILPYRRSSIGTLPWFGGNDGKDLLGDPDTVRRLLDAFPGFKDDGKKFKGRSGLEGFDLFADPPSSEMLDAAAYDDRTALIDMIHEIYYDYLHRCVIDGHLTFGVVATFAFVILYSDSRARESFRTRYLIVDEFQDTNTNQMMISLMLLKEPNLCVVGDWKQGIYGFRFVSIENMTRFEDRVKELTAFLNDDIERVSVRPAEILKFPLLENYRSSQLIIDRAYESLLMTDAFAKSFCGFADRYAKFMVAQNKVLERMLSSLPIPTNTDMKSLYKTVYDLRKEVRDLKKALAAMEEKKGVE